EALVSAMLKEPDDVEWAHRAEYWRTSDHKRPDKRRKFRYREPLILCGHGAGVRVDKGTLLVRNGFTHFPQRREEFRFFPGDVNLPDRIVMIDGSGVISFDALSWMADQSIEFVRLNWRGEVSSHGGTQGYAADPKLVEWQRSIRETR